jgi:hypothetical protein
MADSCRRRGSSQISGVEIRSKMWENRPTAENLWLGDMNKASRDSPGRRWDTLLLTRRGGLGGSA